MEFVRRLWGIRIVRAGIWAALGVVSLVFWLIVFFPTDRVRQIAEIQLESQLNIRAAEQGGSLWDVTIGDASLWWVPGVELHDVLIKERWDEARQAEVARAVEQGAKPEFPLSVTVPRIAAGVSLFRSVIHLGAGLVFDVDFEEGGIIEGVLVARPSGARLMVDIDDLDLSRSRLLMSTTGVPGSGVLYGEIDLELAPKTYAPREGTIELDGRKITVGPATLNGVQGFEMAYIEVPLTNFGTLQADVAIEPGKGGRSVVDLREVSMRGLDVQLELWGSIPLAAAPAKSPLRGVSARARLDERFVKKNSLGPLLNMGPFRTGKSAERWYGLEFAGTLGAPKTPRGSAKATKGAAPAKEEESGARRPTP